MSAEKVASFEELMSDDANEVKYDTVVVHGKRVRIGSCSSLDIITWLEDNNDPEKKRLAGLRLAVKSLVDEKGNRVPDDKREDMVKAFSNKDAKGNGRLVKACLQLNGLHKAAEDAAKNDSPEATGGNSPTGSQGTPAA